MKPTRIRQVARELSLLFSGALGTYLVSTILTGLTAPALVRAARLVESTPVRLALAVLALDGIRAVVLLAAAWAIGPAIRMRPLLAAAALVTMTYGLDLAVAAAIGRLPWLLGALAGRLALAALLLWLCALVIRRRNAARSAH